MSDDPAARMQAQAAQDQAQKDQARARQHAESAEKANAERPGAKTAPAYDHSNLKDLYQVKLDSRAGETRQTAQDAKQGGKPPENKAQEHGLTRDRPPATEAHPESRDWTTRPGDRSGPDHSNLGELSKLGFGLQRPKDQVTTSRASDAERIQDSDRKMERIAGTRPDQKAPDHGGGPFAERTPIQQLNDALKDISAHAQDNRDKAAAGQELFRLQKAMIDSGLRAWVPDPSAFEQSIVGNKAFHDVLDPNTGQVLGYTYPYELQHIDHLAIIDRNGKILEDSLVREPGLESDAISPVDAVQALATGGISAAAKGLARVAGQVLAEGTGKALAEGTGKALAEGTGKALAENLGEVGSKEGAELAGTAGTSIGPASTIPAKEAETFLKRGFFTITDRPSYMVRVGGPEGKYADHIFASPQEAKDYARWLAGRGEASIREASALPRWWPGGAKGNPVDAVRVFEVPKGTPYIQGVAKEQIEVGTAKIYAGGGAQVVVPPNTIGNLVDEFPVTKP